MSKHGHPAAFGLPCLYRDSESDLITDEMRRAAQTVVDTVMAEQVSRNVVGKLESTSGSPLVDAHANDQTTSLAESGSEILFPTKTFPIDHSHLPAKIDDELAPSDIRSAAAAFEDSANPKVALTAAEDNTLTNGIHAVDGLIDGRSTPDISGNVSVSSETDGSRTDALEQGKDNTSSHVRTNSVKKPTTFSKVSVTKNFLAKTATGTVAPISAPPSSKASPLSATPIPIAKPRLIAKTGPSLISKPRIPGDSAGAPDASKVWNKNRAPQPVPTKQFTDEELKQQYGIHMASRLQSDDNSKESKWADIDEDEDDWAPATVVWMDGTKSSLTPAENAPAQKEPAPSQPPVKPAEPVKPTLLQAKKPSETGTVKTILKPGAAVQAKQSGATSSSPGPESKIATSSSPAPMPAKSPWRLLPAVDKVPIVNPPVQQPERPYQSQDVRSLDPIMPTQPPPEMAPDSFDRPFKESEGGHRELFNSANGLYEPAPESRRSTRTDPQGRKPSVLQRHHVNDSPAEPSAAFQTRSQGDSVSWDSRRRGSSLSQGSATGRRMSLSRPQEMPPTSLERRQSTVIGRDLNAGPPQGISERPKFGQQSTWDQQLPPPPDGSTEEVREDPVAVQQRLMKEKREEAIRRRKEEEERLEAEKQERLKVKLAALEGVGKSKKEREAEEAAKKSDTPVADKAAESVQSVQAEIQPADGPKAAEIAAKAAPSLEAQTPVPAQTPQMRESPQISDERLETPSPIPPKVHDAELGNRQNPREHISPRAGSRGTFDQQPAPNRQPLSAFSSPGDRPQQPFNRPPANGNDAFGSWPSTAPNGNIWGSSGVGNGTFSIAPMPLSQQGASLPPPPGMAQSNTGSTRISPQGFVQGSRSPNMKHQQPSDTQPTLVPPGISQRPETWPSQSRGNGVSQAPGIGRQAHPPGPIAPPRRSQAQQPQKAPPTPSTRQEQVAAWNEAAAKLPQQYKADVEAAERRKEEMMAAGSQTRERTIKETFKKILPDQGVLGGPRRFQSTEHTIHDQAGSRTVAPLSPAPPVSQTQPAAPLPTSSPLDSWRTGSETALGTPEVELNSAAPQPPIARPVIPPHLRASNVNFRAGPLPQVPGFKDESPPPPETQVHPAFDGTNAPKVRLPLQKPVVKLPPAPAPQPLPSPLQQNSVMMPHRSQQNWAPPGVARPIAMDPAWQARFNGLFNRTPIQTETPPSPPKTPPKIQGPALAVASSSKGTMDEVQVAGTRVSLPLAKKSLSPEGFTVDESNAPESKPGIEQMFSEELSFGSQPTVRVPRYLSPFHTAFADGVTVNVLELRPDQRPKAVETQAKSELPSREIFTKSKNGIFVKLLANGLKNKLVFYDGSSPQSTPIRKPIGKQQERKPSSSGGRFGSRGKSADGGRDSGPSTPRAPPPWSNSTPSSSSRKPGHHKPSPGSVATTKSASRADPEAASNGKRESTKRPRPPRSASNPQTPRL